MIKKINILLAFLTLLVLRSNAQQEISLYYLGNNVYQSVELNPALMPEKDNYGIFSHYFNFSHSGFAIEDVLFKNDSINQFEIRLDSLVNALNDGDNFLSINNTLNLFSFKWKYRRNYYAFGINEKVNSTFYYPSDFFGMLLRGNASYLGDTLDLGIGYRAMHYREYAFNYMKKLKRWDLGVRVKLLTGFETLDIKSRADSTYIVTNDAPPYDLHASYAYGVNMAGHSRIQSLIDGGDVQDAFLNTSYFLDFSNLGLGFDFGAVYHIDKKLKLSMSVIDIGSIEWKSDDVENISLVGEYAFDGVDVFGVYTSEEGVSDIDAITNNLIDSMRLNESQTYTTNNFTTNLTPKHYASLNYNLIDSFMLGLVWYGEYYQGYRPSFSIGLNKQVWKYMNLGLNYSIKNRSYANMGASFVLNLGGIQFFALSDNVYSILDYKSVKNINIRWGLNARFRIIKPRFRPKEG